MDAMQSSIYRVFPWRVNYIPRPRRLRFRLIALSSCKRITCLDSFHWINLSPRLQLLDRDAYPVIIATGEPSPSNLTALFSELTYPSHLTTHLPLVVSYQSRGASSEKHSSTWPRSVIRCTYLRLSLSGVIGDGVLENSSLE